MTRNDPARRTAPVLRSGDRVPARTSPGSSIRTGFRSPGDADSRGGARPGALRRNPAPDGSAPRTVTGAFRNRELPSGTSPARGADGRSSAGFRPVPGAASPGAAGAGDRTSRRERTGTPGFLGNDRKPAGDGRSVGALGTRPGGDGFVRGPGTVVPIGGKTSTTGGGGTATSGSALTGGSATGTTAFRDASLRSGWRGPSLYREGFRNGYRVGYRDGRDDRHHYHDWYDRHGFSLSFFFSVGSYWGVNYYWPYHHYYSGIDYAFFYPAAVTHCYVPFGFYYTTSPVYVTRSVYVREVPVTEYVVRETVTVEEADEYGEAGPVDGAPEDALAPVEPLPAAGSPATEKFLRDASALFHEGKYYEAAVKFRLAALSSPDNPGPLFALGQSLLAMGEDAYAARVLRKAVTASPSILKEPADISGVYGSSGDFDRVMAELEERAAASPVDGDARFLLGYQRYFIGDPRAREVFDLLHLALPEDEAVGLFRAAIGERFKAADELLPPLVAPGK